MSARQHLLDYDADRLAEFFAAAGAEPYRAKQVLEWVYDRGALSFDQMTNLSKPLRQRLADRFDLFASTILRRAASSDGTVKLLLQWPDGATSECVMIPADGRNTACISSQVGCPVGCRFCASGLDGVQRNLTAGQIVEQVLRAGAEAEQVAQSPAAPTGAPPHTAVEARRPRLSNVVFMGLGEPLANYENVIRAVRTINAPWGPCIGARKITLSTVGLPKQIRRLADEGLQLNLALSLHAPNDALRAELIPWAEKISIAQLTSACRYYFDQTGREITLEYILLGGVNDGRSEAAQLARFARGLRCNVNLIRYNPVEGLPYERPTSEATAAFQRYLRDHGVNSHVRTSRGLDIDAACGQLRRREMISPHEAVALNRPAQPLSG
jgi:23S rRNA (adenine2503-C2)-methyltransferase